MMDKHLLAQMERLRGMMVATAIRKQNILHRDVLLLSQMLDQLIMKAQADKHARLKTNKTSFKEETCGQST
jgi:hypothetical protein